MECDRKQETELYVNPQYQAVLRVFCKMQIHPKLLLKIHRVGGMQEWATGGAEGVTQKERGLVMAPLFHLFISAFDFPPLPPIPTQHQNLAHIREQLKHFPEGFFFFPVSPCPKHWHNIMQHKPENDPIIKHL